MATVRWTFEVPISMLGARGVGKTSLLAAMCSEFDSSFDDRRLQLIPAAQTQVTLDALLIDLKRVVDGPAAQLFDPTDVGVEPTTLEERHELTLALLDRKAPARLEVAFHD